MAGPEQIPHPEWSPLPVEGAVGIEGKVLLRPPPVALALLRFGREAGFPAHAAPFDVDVICLDGAGFTLVGEDEYPLLAGERVRWPADALHRLWTESSEMTTLMVELGTWDESS